MKPTIYLSNWASRRTPGHHGPGRKLTIMRNPRAWEHGDGRVTALIPALVDLRAYRSSTITAEEYRKRYEAGLVGDYLVPGRLWSTAEGGSLVRDGDTLCCSCSRAAAADGLCHRVRAAAALVRAGWRVILDGVEVTL